MSANLIQDASCDHPTASSNSFVWDTVSDGVALSGATESNVVIRVVEQSSGMTEVSTGTFTVSNPTTVSTPTSYASGNFTGEDFVCDGTTITMDGTQTFGTLVLTNGCIIQHGDNTTTKTNTLEITATTVTVDGSSRFDVTGRGYQGVKLVVKQDLVLHLVGLVEVLTMFLELWELMVDEVELEPVEVLVRNRFRKPNGSG